MEIRVFVHSDHDIPLVITYPENKVNCPCILMLHGLLSYKEGDGYLFQKFAQELKKQGIASARFDFCSMGENRCSREEYGIKVMLEETKTIFEYLQNDPLIDSNRIGIMGHSLGGRIAILSASLPSKCIITLNGVLNIEEKPFGEMPIFNTYKDKEYTLNKLSDGRIELLFKKFYEECNEITNKDIYKYDNPILVCVGASDPTINPNISYSFVKQHQKKNINSVTIEDANHTFNAKTGDYTKVYELITVIKLWLRKNL